MKEKHTNINRRLANRKLFVNRVPRILAQRAENGVFRVALQGAVSNHPFSNHHEFAPG